jgi:hypothetical protein
MERHAMEKWLEYLRFIPAYVIDLVALISGPKSFLSSRNSPSDENWVRALQFFLISSVISLVLDTSRASGKQAEFYSLLGQNLVEDAIAVLAFALCIKVSWTLVGGKAPLSSFILIQLYSVSSFDIAISIHRLAELRAIDIFAPNATKLENVLEERDFAIKMHKLFATKDEIAEQGLAGPIIQVLSTLIILSLLFAWIAAIWGAYRDLNRLSRQRSLVAFVLLILLGIPAGFILSMVG